MDDPVDPNLRPAADRGAVEDRGSGGEEHIVLEGAAREVGAGPDQHVVTDRHRVPLRASDHGVLHHDAAPPHLDRAALGGEHGAEQDPRALTDPDVPAQDSGGGHVG